MFTKQFDRSEPDFHADAPRKSTAIKLIKTTNTTVISSSVIPAARRGKVEILEVGNFMKPFFHNYHNLKREKSIF